jgi:RNA polymerase sigma-70 factor (ECF subfamily)
LDLFSRSAPVTLDTALLKRVAEGESNAFSELFDAAAPLLFGMLHRILGNDDVAAELLQEVLLGARARAAEYDPSLGAPMTWLVTTARKKALDRLRMSGARREFGALIWQAIADLPPAQQEALELAFYEGLTQDEIAERLKVPPGMITTRIAQAMETLRGSLQSTWEDTLRFPGRAEQ